MIAKLVHPLEVAVKDMQVLVVITLPPGVTVEFETTEGPARCHRADGVE